MFIQGFRSKHLTLLQHELIQIGQNRRVETDGVFHQQNHLYSHFLDIMFQVHLVLYQLDDGHQQVGIPQPTEDIFKDTQVLVLHTLPNTMRERRQHHQGNFGIFLFDGTGNVERITVVGTRHDYHQIELGIPKLLPRFLLRRYLRKAGRIAEAQVHVLIEYLLVNTSVIFQHECIVRIGNQQYIEYTLGHQVHKRCILEV